MNAACFLILQPPITFQLIAKAFVTFAQFLVPLVSMFAIRNRQSLHPKDIGNPETIP